MGRGDVPPALTVFSDSLGVIYGLSVVHCLSSSSARVGFPDSSVSKESTCNAGDLSSIPGSGRSAGEGIGYPLQYSWASLVAQLVKNPPAMRETWVGKNPWRKERILTPVFWPGEFHGPYSPWSHKELDTTEQLSLPPSARVSLQEPRIQERRRHVWRAEPQGALSETETWFSLNCQCLRLRLLPPEDSLSLHLQYMLHAKSL